MGNVKVTIKDKPDSKTRIWFRKAKDNLTEKGEKFIEWYFSPWTVKDHLAWIGFWACVSGTVSTIVTIVRICKKKK